MKASPPRLSTHRLHLTGEVVEILFNGKKQVAKVLLKSCSIEIPTELHLDLHLGDCIEIVGEMPARIIVPSAARKIRKTKV